MQSVLKNRSLQVFNNTMAQKILLNAQNHAEGVVASSGDRGEFTLEARKEVILSAGVFQSPQLLMVSGIGPRSKLEALRIPVKVDLPGVGENLIDHPLLAGSQRRVNIATASAGFNNPAINALAIEAYNKFAAGPLTIPNTGFLGWERLPSRHRQNLTASSRKALDTAFPADWPELEFIPFNAAAGFQHNYATTDPIDGFNYASIAISMVAPLSRGTVTIASSNISEPPLIDPQFLSHPADAELAVAAIRRSREIWAAIPDLLVGDEWLPGPAVQSDADILEYVRQSLAPTWHAAGTCRMGKKGDRMAVVDGRGRVLGTSGLRVVDASVFPILPPGHPQSTIYALAEKIAEEVLRDT